MLEYIKSGQSREELEAASCIMSTYMNLCMVTTQLIFFAPIKPFTQAQGMVLPTVGWDSLHQLMQSRQSFTCMKDHSD